MLMYKATAKSTTRVSPTRIHMLLKKNGIPSSLVVVSPRCGFCLFVSYLRTYANATCARGQGDMSTTPFYTLMQEGGFQYDA